MERAMAKNQAEPMLLYDQHIDSQLNKILFVALPHSLALSLENARESVASKQTSSDGLSEWNTVEFIVI
jgi:hypothetical protein